MDRSGKVSPWEIMSMRPYLVVSAPSAGVLNVCKVKNVPFKTKNMCDKCVLSMREPSLPCLLDRYWHKSFAPSTLIFDMRLIVRSVPSSLLLLYVHVDK